MSHEGKCRGGPWDGKQLKSEHSRVQLSYRNAMTSLTPPQTTNEPDFVLFSFFGEYVWAGPGPSRAHWLWEVVRP